MRILFSVTSHGLGHFTRTAAVLNEFCRFYPDVDVIVSTGINGKRVARDTPESIDYRKAEYEPGTAQKNCFQIDIQGTRNIYDVFNGKREDLLRREEEFLLRNKCDGMVSDISALSIRAAANIGIPAVGISNFTWDWILEPIFENTPLEAITKQLREDYSKGQLHLCLPCSPDTSPFPHSEPAPLVSRSAVLSPQVVYDRLNIPMDSDKSLVVVCPGGWDPDSWNHIEVSGCEQFRFILVGDLPISTKTEAAHLPHDLPFGISFPDLVNMADIVLGKPGYGIASECVSHQTPSIQIERPDFRETPILMKWLKKMGPCADISLANFFSGNWEPSLLVALNADRPWISPSSDGAVKIALRLGKFFGLPTIGS